ncbi:hypothetical protein E0H73_40965 [Kribbella pittospori]|uniref:Uncharacterized protein n=1 Tax=Kribbella pittospori TaxID=722689 RepID=A0A4V2M8H2_9ACTN|nr:hypothetical protein [Kribbella pittospori]TCC51492.1 hypothetical protein E0H73_40965 [Kribbella pittospori]
MAKVVAELIAEDSLAEIDSARMARIGRAAIAVALVPAAYQVLGVQVGAGSVQLGWCDLLARPGASVGFSFDLATTPAEQVVGAIADHAGRLIGDNDRGLGVGVAAPGPVDRALRRNLLSITWLARRGLRRSVGGGRAAAHGS